MNRPLIGITSSFSIEPEHQRRRAYLNAAYTDAVFAAGGIPVQLPVPASAEPQTVEDILSRVDGVIFSGGPDVRPDRYGQGLHEKTGVMDDRRDAFEFSLFDAAEKSGKPILAICLGCQIASVVRGGCLIQHLPDVPRPTDIIHFRDDGGSAFHRVRLDPASRLGRIVGKTDIEVNSRHHQAVDPGQVGGRLRPVGFAPDGTVEAAEDVDGRFLIAVQWHPEDLIDRPEHLCIFKALVDEAAGRVVARS